MRGWRGSALLAALLVLVLGGAIALRGWVLSPGTGAPPATEVLRTQPLVTMGAEGRAPAATRKAPAFRSDRQALVQKALDLMERHGVKVREGWEIRDCTKACDRDSLGETYPETRGWHCVTYLAWPNLRATAQDLGVPLVHVTAWVLTHEQVHCDDTKLGRNNLEQAERVAEAEAFRFAERLGHRGLASASREYLASIDGR